MIYSKIQVQDGKEKNVTIYNLKTVRNALLRGQCCWLMTFNTENSHDEPYMELKLSLSTINNFDKIHCDLIKETENFISNL
jgi:hypothetical protein